MKKFLVWCVAVVAFATIIWGIGSLFIQKTLADATLEVLASPGNRTPIVKAFFSSNTLYVLTFILFTLIAGITLFQFVPKTKFNRLNTHISRHLNTATTDDKTLVSSLSKLMIIAAIFFSCLLAMNLSFSFMGLQDQMGVFGDFLGGVLNPVLSFLSLIAILLTIILQSRELSETREEIKRSANAQEKSEQALNGQLALQAKQSFETTFFNLISLHNSILNSLTVDLNSIGPTLNISYTEPGDYRPLGPDGRLIWVGEKTEFSGRELYQQLLNLIATHANNDPSNIQKLYTEVNSQHNEVLGHYFRNFYQTLKFLEEGLISDSEKKRYASILRAQLSSFELALLFLNCIDDTVDTGAFRQLLCRYKMLEHLPILRAEVDAHSDHGILALYTFANSGMVIADEAMVEQYLLPQNLNSKNQVEFGAFGTNRVITEVYSETPLSHPE